MTKPLQETRAGTLSKNAFSEIVRFTEKADAVALGPGLSANPETQALIRRLIAAVKKPLVIDADGLNALSGKLRLFRTRTQPAVITPHPGEMARLLRISTGEVQKRRKALASEVAREYGITVVLKGYQTVVADSSGNVYVNDTGNPGMASGGTGDVLTGIIVSFLGQGIPAFESAKLAVYIHGLAGDLAAKEKGEISLIAVDILNYLPAVFKRIV
jgi:NAD(P)H-hydrate epimerase